MARRPRGQRLDEKRRRGVREPAVVARAEGREAERSYLELWRSRDRQSWLAERLEFPVEAVVAVPSLAESMQVPISGLRDRVGPPPGIREMPGVLDAMGRR